MIWGSTYCRINNDSLTVNMPHSIIEPNFMIPAQKMHESILTGTRTWSNLNNYLEFSITDYLFKYDSPIAQANHLLALENTIVTFAFAIDGGLILSMYLESVDIHPLFQPWRKDIAVLNLKSVEYLRVSRRIKTKDGKWIKTADGNYLTTKGIII